MQISKGSSLSLEPELVHSPSPHHHNMISDLLSSTISTSLLSGDYIGMESCVDVGNDTALGGGTTINKAAAGPHSYSQKLRGKREERLAMKRKEFPPPIPLLARTENLHSHMPWVLRRHYTSDGRLILTEEKVRHHEYFMAHRSNGRLRLQLVPLDDDGSVSAPPHPPPSVCCDEEECECECECDGDDDHEDNVDAYDDGDDDEKDEEGDDNHVVEESSNGGKNSNIGVGGGGGGGESSSSSNNNGKCLNFNSVGTGSPCIFGVPVPAIRQVHS